MISITPEVGSSISSYASHNAYALLFPPSRFIQFIGSRSSSSIMRQMACTVDQTSLVISWLRFDLVLFKHSVFDHLQMSDIQKLLAMHLLLTSLIVFVFAVD